MTTIYVFSTSAKQRHRGGRDGQQLLLERKPQVEELSKEPGTSQRQPEKTSGKREEESSLPRTSRSFLQVVSDFQICRQRQHP